MDGNSGFLIILWFKKVKELSYSWKCQHSTFWAWYGGAPSSLQATSRQVLERGQLDFWCPLGTFQAGTILSAGCHHPCWSCWASALLASGPLHLLFLHWVSGDSPRTPGHLFRGPLHHAHHPSTLRPLLHQAWGLSEMVVINYSVVFVCVSRKCRSQKVSTRPLSKYLLDK